MTAPQSEVDQTGMLPVRLMKSSVRASFLQLSRMTSGLTADRNSGDVELREP